MNKRERVGFTLVEVMVVVAIIALLAAIAIPNLMRAKVEANQSFAKSTLKAIGTALETYSSTNSRYPALTTDLLGVTPPYLTTDYFSGSYFNGYSFAATLAPYTYSVVATPSSPTQGTTITLSTGGLISP